MGVQWEFSIIVVVELVLHDEHFKGEVRRR
jgi:hypothetical protein